VALTVARFPAARAISRAAGSTPVVLGTTAVGSSLALHTRSHHTLVAAARSSSVDGSTADGAEASLYRSAADSSTTPAHARIGGGCVAYRPESDLSAERDGSPAGAERRGLGGRGFDWEQR